MNIGTKLELMLATQKHMMSFSLVMGYLNHHYQVGYYRKNNQSGRRGITTILSAMKSHSSNANVQHYGCGALWTLAFVDKYKVEIAEGRGITTSLSAMKGHSSNSNVQHYGVEHFGNLL
jgi:hypothetical protein